MGAVIELIDPNFCIVNFAVVAVLFLSLLFFFGFFCFLFFYCLVACLCFSYIYFLRGREKGFI